MDVEHDDPEPKQPGCVDCGVDRGTCKKCNRCIFCADKITKPRGGCFCRGCVDNLVRVNRDWRDRWHALAMAQGQILDKITKEMGL